ncbi:MAG: anti-sigma factor family protein [Candidatus Kapaibacterium sp.]
MEEFTLSEKLILYLDGELPQEQELELFTRLASSADLRAEMREGLAIRAAIGGDIDAFTPSAAQTSAVFSGLGFTPPYQQTPSQKTSSRYMWLPLLWLLGGLCVGGGLAFWFTQNLLNQEFADEKRELNKTIAQLQSEKNRQKPAVMSSMAIEPSESAITKKPLVKTVIIYRDRFIAPANQNPDTAISAKTEDINTQSQSAENISTAYNQQVYNSKDDMMITSRNLPSSVHNNQPMISMSLFPKFWTQIRGIGTVSQYPNISANSAITGLSNVNVALGYSFNPNLAAGIEIGREPFMLKYSGTVNGRTVRYEQQSSMLLGGLIVQARTNPIESFMDIQPVGTLFLGGSEIGMMGRVSSGIYYPLSANVSFYGGLEYSLMNFTYQSNSFTTQKVGFTYGLHITF